MPSAKSQQNSIKFPKTTLRCAKIYRALFLTEFSFLSIAVFIPNIPANARWAENGVTVAGGYGPGNALNQLNKPLGLYVDNDQTIYIADKDNHRIVEWKPGAISGKVVAGGNGPGGRADQLNEPLDVIVDKETDSFIICDMGNKRVMRWSRQNRTSGQTIIDNINCSRLTMDNQRFLYVSEVDEVRRYGVGETNGTVVAGGNGRGDRLNQLSDSTHVFVDQEYSVYVSDWETHRVMKWMKGARKGTVVADDGEEGNALSYLLMPQGVFVDQLGTLYVVNDGNDSVMRWYKGATQGDVIVGVNGTGQEANQLSNPKGLSFDRHGNLYVVDQWNHRVQRFSIMK
ncbi:unnamed protein product [Rotaria sp. Silwood2]|nr:unnamed protein product [Rotaria sp. Silwood2]CAF2921426.1 unnamed protein product [Rotaria sp. Silwood2]CAF3306869.1 unnamed protein product [Rotaria sp. Silwood2]CAF4121643.1 unnamed protein product [Rotaria sp. Silwood2]CAF4368820.1 unnamed protein product [Rotaria sp. Silwood2]